MSNEKDETAQQFHVRADDWLTAALFDRDPGTARAAEANLRRALRHEDGQDAALMAIGEFPCLVQSQLPRLWAMRQEVLKERRAARAGAERGVEAAGVKSFSLARSLAAGRAGQFVDGPTREFQVRWMDCDGAVFEVAEGGRPRLAADELRQFGEMMSQDMYRTLHRELERMRVLFKQGRDGEVDQEMYRDLMSVIEAAPWTMDAHHGCVRVGEFDAEDGSRVHCEI